MAARHFHYFHTLSNTSLGCTEQHISSNVVFLAQLNSKKDIQILLFQFYVIKKLTQIIREKDFAKKLFVEKS